MCQACVPGISVDGYDCDSDLDFHSEDECACPQNHQEQQHHNHKPEYEENDKTVEEDISCSETVIFPSDPFFARLIDATHRLKNEIIINDDTHGLHLTYAQLLHDVQALRLKIQSGVSVDLLDANGMFKEGAGYIGVLAEIQYPFFVASLAILSLGGVIVPMGHAPEVEQVLLVLDKSKAVALVFDPAQGSLASAIQKENKYLIQLSVDINQAEKSLKDHKKLRFITDSTDALNLSPGRPALLLYGGDSEEPDVLTRQTFYEQATVGSKSATAEMKDAMILCILICLSCGPPPS